MLLMSSARRATARFKSEEAANAVMSHVEGQTSGVVSAIEKKKKRTQACSGNRSIPRRLWPPPGSEGLSPARTTRLAESLYMDGYISHPRIDNTVYPESLDLEGTVKKLSDVAASSSVLPGTVGGARELPRAARRKRPTIRLSTPRLPADPDKLGAPEWKLYSLIARRLATLSDAAVIEGTKVTIEVNAEPFAVRGDVVVKPGFRAIYPYGMKKEEQLPALLSKAERSISRGAVCKRSRLSRRRATARASSFRKWSAWA